MGKLVYSTITSLDGFIEGEAGGFDWAEPDEEVHNFANDLELIDERRFVNGTFHVGYCVRR